MIIDNEPHSLKYVFSVSERPSFDADTKSVKTSWEDGDRIYIVFDDILPTSIDDLLILKYSNEEWAVEKEPANVPSTSGGTLDALYYAGSDLNPYLDNNEFIINASLDDFGKYMYLTSNNVPYVIKDGVLESSLSLDFDSDGSSTYVQFCVTGLSGDWTFYQEDILELENEFSAWTPSWKNSVFSHYSISHPSFNYVFDVREDGHYIYLSTLQEADKITITLVKTSGDNAGKYSKTFSKKICGKRAAITFKGPQFDNNGECTNGWIPIDRNIVFTDSIFKAYMVKNHDLDSDEEISMGEALKIKEIKVNTNKITSVQGIEYCKNLERLDCSSSTWQYDNTLQQSVPSGLLTTLDVSCNTSLTSLNCQFNRLTSLDLSNNTALVSLNCRSNYIEDLVLGNKPSLTHLECRSNRLTNLCISECSALNELHCDNNQLTSLDISSNPVLVELLCRDNLLSNIVFTNNTALKTLDCRNNQLTNLDVSINQALTILICWNNQLTSIDVSGCSLLSELNCDGNQLTNLDVSNNLMLKDFGCERNNLTSLDISNNTMLIAINCSNNQLTNINVSNNTELIKLYCENTQVTSLDVSNNLLLMALRCESNPYLEEIWLKNGQTIPDFSYDSNIATVKYKD